MSPNKENIRKWVAALRSNKYQQAYERLRNEDCFCALGVGCEVYRQETQDGRWDPHFGHFISGNDSCRTGFPQNVRNWFGLRNSPSAKTPDGRDFISNLNDKLRLTLPEIADHIENTYLT